MSYWPVKTNPTIATGMIFDVFGFFSCFAFALQLEFLLWSFATFAVKGPEQLCSDACRIFSASHLAMHLARFQSGEYHCELSLIRQTPMAVRHPRSSHTYGQEKRSSHSANSWNSASRTLRKIVARTEQDGRDADVGTAQDIADRARQLLYQGVSCSTRATNERQTAAIGRDRSLAPIREGVFGECINCGNDINAKRLEAVPWTR